MDFILAKGFNIQQVSEFANGGRSIRQVNALDMFDDSPMMDDSSGTQLLGLVSEDGGLRKVAAPIVSADLEEGELPCSPKSSRKEVAGLDLTGYLGVSQVKSYLGALL